jgi:hypothetical protein
MNYPSLSSQHFLFLGMGLALFLGGCTFLLNSEELLQECVTEIDCADGFYCDDGACLPGEAPLPFNPQEPNLPTFNDDAGAPQDPAQPANDAGQSIAIARDAGTAATFNVDSGVAPAIETDAGMPSEEVSDAGHNNSPVVETDAGQDTATAVDSGTTATIAQDAGAQDLSGAASDGGQGTAQATDAG